MTRNTARARYQKGVLTLLEPLAIEEGKEVEVSVRASDLKNPTPTIDLAEAEMNDLRKTAGEPKGLLDDGFTEMIYASRIVGSRDNVRGEG